MRHETQPYDKVRATLEIVSAGQGQTGLTPTVAIRRLSDNQWLQAGGGSWGAGFATNNMVEPDATNLPGLYQYAIPGGQLSVVGGASGYMMRILEANTGLLETLLVHALPDISSITASAIADAVWTEQLTDHNGVAGSVAEALSQATPGGIADAVWDEAAADHNTAGTMGELLNNAGGGASPAAIADAVWNELLNDHLTAGSTGRAVAIIQGLVQGNHRIRNPTYDPNGRLLTCQLVVYPTSADALNETNPIATMNVTSTYNGAGNLESLLSRE